MHCKENPAVTWATLCQKVGLPLSELSHTPKLERLNWFWLKDDVEKYVCNTDPVEMQIVDQ